MVPSEAAAVHTDHCFHYHYIFPPKSDKTSPKRRQEIRKENLEPKEFIYIQ
jgi:hypothetical protein